MTRYFKAESFNDLKRILTSVERPRVKTAIYRAVVEDNADSIGFLEKMFRQHGIIFINATYGMFSSCINPKYDEVIVLERYKL